MTGRKKVNKDINKLIIKFNLESTLTHPHSQTMRGSRKFLKGKVQLWQHFFWLMRGDGIKIPLTVGVSLACRWRPYIECCLGSFVIFMGSVPVFAEKPIFLRFFRGVRTPYPPSGSAHANLQKIKPIVSKLISTHAFMSLYQVLFLDFVCFVALSPSQQLCSCQDGQFT